MRNVLSLEADNAARTQCRSGLYRPKIPSGFEQQHELRIQAEAERIQREMLERGLVYGPMREER